MRYAVNVPNFEEYSAVAVETASAADAEAAGFVEAGTKATANEEGDK